MSAQLAAFRLHHTTKLQVQATVCEKWNKFQLHLKIKHYKSDNFKSYFITPGPGLIPDLKN